MSNTDLARLHYCEIRKRYKEVQGQKRITWICLKCLVKITQGTPVLSSNFPQSNNERKSEQSHIPHATTLPENAVCNEWQFQALVMGNRTKKPVSSELHKIILAKVKKGYKLLL